MDNHRSRDEIVQRAFFPIGQQDEKLTPNPNILDYLQRSIPRRSKLGYSLVTFHPSQRVVFGVTHVQHWKKQRDRHQQAKNEIRKISENGLAVANRFTIHFSNANTHHELARRAPKASHEVNAVKQSKQGAGNQIIK